MRLERYSVARVLRLAAVLAPIVFAGCASQFRPVDLGSLQGVREERFPSIGQWVSADGTLSNVIPPGASMQDVLSARDGIGVAAAVDREFTARDLVAEVKMGFTSTGAASFIFRVQTKGEIVQSCYSVVLGAQGLILWRLRDGEWWLLYRHVIAEMPEEPRVVRAEARGENIEVFLDGKRVFEVKDAGLLLPGHVGLSAREGPCQFYWLKVKKLEKDTDK